MANFDESKHPRDDDGKFTDGNGSRWTTSKRDYSNVQGGEAQRVFDEAKQLGIDTKGIDNLDVIKARLAEKRKEVEFEQSFFDKAKEIANKFESPKPSYQHGVEDVRLKSVLDELGYTKKPQKLSTADFAKEMQKGKLYFRGMSEQKYVDAFYNGDCFIGQGLSGNGIYLTEDASEAYSNYGKGLKDNVAFCIISDDMRIAGEKEKNEYKALMSSYYDEKLQSVKKRGDNAELAEFFSIRDEMTYALYLAMRGFDGYTGLKATNIVLLNRGKVKVGENPNEIKRFFIK